jgi:hypothetical protein
VRGTAVELVLYIQLRIQKTLLLVRSTKKTSSLVFACMREFGSQQVIADNQWDCFSGELRQLELEPATDPESIVVRYRWWNCDRVIEYVMSTTKGSGKEDSLSSSVIQRVIREVRDGSSYPTLTKMNYSDWALLMKVKLKARGLWAAVEPGGGDL